MASTYSPNLRLELIGTGEQQGTWGITTNTNLGTLLEEAIGGYTSVTVADAGDTTLTTNNGSADQSRNMTINLTGALTGARNVICPAIEKVYIVKNATTGGQAVTFKVSGQTGVSIPNGSTYILYVNGTDAVLATGTIAAQNANNVSITGGSITGITDLAVADGGTGASTAAGAATNLGLGTGDSPQFAGVNIGNATDTTITRSSAGVIAVEGKPVVMTTGAQTVEFAAGSNTAPSITTTGDTNTGIFFPAADTIAFTEGGTEAMRIDSSGNVGIGTTDFTYGQLATSGAISINASSASKLSWNNSGNYFNWIECGGTPSANYMRFATGNAERMRIDSSGNVGIGTSSPATKIHSYGTTTNGATVRAELSGADGVYFDLKGGTSYRALTATTSAGVLDWAIGSYGSTIGAYVAFYTGSSGTERIRIGPSGQLGIGGANYGTSGQVLTSGGSGSAPTWSSLSISLTTQVTGTLPVANGGTGVTSSTGTGSVVLSASPALTGTPTAPSAAGYNDSTQIATTAQVYDTVTTVPENAQTGTSYTLVLADAGKMVTLSNASAITLTIPTNASVAFPVDTRIDILQYGAGQVTVGGAGVTIRSSGSQLKLSGQYSGATLWKKDTDEWVLIGDITT